jgi:polysaccharide export outer membrane protein
LTGFRPAGIDEIATNRSPVASVSAKPVVAPDADVEARKLRPGDRITLRLSGMRVPVEVVDVLDEKGAITLELLGSVSLAGMTTTEAEDKIEKEYIDRQIYKSISVSIVVEQSWYYVRGEVNQPGRFVLTEALTLMQALAAAGGYTDFAKPSKVKIMRGEDVLYFDASRIERRQDKDPLIRRGDTIIVERTSI